MSLPAIVKNIWRIGRGWIDERPATREALLEVAFATQPMAAVICGHEPIGDALEQIDQSFLPHKRPHGALLLRVDGALGYHAHAHRRERCGYAVAIFVYAIRAEWHPAAAGRTETLPVVRRGYRGRWDFGRKVFKVGGHVD